MKFVDHVQIRVKAGDGGNGCVAFRREKFIPFGGPAGGDGGNGGSVVFIADEGRNSLLDLVHLPVLEAKRGEHGRGKDQYGRRGNDLLVKVPIGTQAFDASTQALIADLSAHGQTAIVARGGKGGRGNIHFASPFDRAPRRAEPGIEGEERVLRLELKVLADVGLVGFPNVGKSTLVAALSAARPKVADYPFTTLRPHLGVVRIGGRDSASTFVMADIPGLIPGASEGKGIGIRFLKHVERCKAILHLVAPPTDTLREEGRSPLRDFDAIMRELEHFAPELAARPMIVAMSKGDISETREAFEHVKKQFARRGVPIRLISAATRNGLDSLAADLFKLLQQGPAEKELPARKQKKIVGRTDKSTSSARAASSKKRTPGRTKKAAKR